MQKYILLSPEQYASLKKRTDAEVSSFTNKIASLEKQIAELLQKKNSVRNGELSTYSKYALYRPALQSYLKHRNERASLGGVREDGTEDRTDEKREAILAAAAQPPLKQEVSPTKIKKNLYEEFASPTLKGEEEETFGKQEDFFDSDEVFDDAVETPKIKAEPFTPDPYRLFTPYFNDTLSSAGRQGLAFNRTDAYEFEKWRQEKSGKSKQRDLLGRPFPRAGVKRPNREDIRNEAEKRLKMLGKGSSIAVCSCKKKKGISSPQQQHQNGGNRGWLTV